MGIPAFNVNPKHVKSLCYGALYTSVVVVTVFNLGGAAYLFFSPAGVLWRNLLDALSAFPPAKRFLYPLLVLIYFGIKIGWGLLFLFALGFVEASTQGSGFPAGCRAPVRQRSGTWIWRSRATPLGHSMLRPPKGHPGTLEPWYPGTPAPLL